MIDECNMFVSLISPWRRSDFKERTGHNCALGCVCDQLQSVNRCVSSGPSHRDGDGQVSERASEWHRFLINVTSGPIRVGTVIAGTRPVPAGLPQISLSLPLRRQSLITSNHRKSLGSLSITQIWKKDKERAGIVDVFCFVYVSVSFSPQGEVMDEVRGADSGLDCVLVDSRGPVTPVCRY